MTGWRTLHATIESSPNLPTEDEIAEFIATRADRDPRVHVTDDSLYVCLPQRNADPLKTFAKQHIDAFGKIALGSGDDTGPGNDSVQFYDTENGRLEADGRRRDCPIARDGLRIESTR